MIPILAHHLEAHHVGIAICLFTAGAVAGWMGCSKWFFAKTRDEQIS